jgi:hypothetical protein
MPSSAVHTFTDPDDYAEAIRAATAELTLSGRGHFTAKRTRIDLHHLWIQRFSDNLPRTIHAAHMAGRAFITFRTQPGPSLLAGGVELRPSTVMRHGEAHSYYQRSSGSACFGAMSLPVEEMISVGAALAGCDLMPPRDALTLTPPPAVMATLQRLHAAAGQLAEDAPAVIAHPEAARALEQALIEAMVGCLSTGEVREDRSAQRRHAMILRRFRRAVDENPDEPPGTLRVDRGAGPNVAGMLPGATGDEPQAILAVAPDASGTACAARECPNRDNRDGNRHAIRLLAIRAVRRRIPVALRGIAVHHARSPARVAASRRSLFFCVPAKTE